MSIWITRWARSLGLKGNIRNVMLELAWRADNHKGQCYPGHAMLAAELGLGVATVRRTIDTLCEAGHITRSFRYDRRGKRSSNLYVVNAPTTARDDHKKKPSLVITGDATSDQIDTSLVITENRTTDHCGGDHYIERSGSNKSGSTNSQRKGQASRACARGPASNLPSQEPSQQPATIAGLENLNGTAVELAGFIQTHARVEPEVAQRMLATNIQAFGSQSMLEAYVKVQAEMAAGLVAQPYKLLIAIAGRLRDQRRKPKEPVPYGAYVLPNGRYISRF